MFAIYKKEMRSYFTNPIGYVFSGIFLVFSALLCCYTTLLSKSYDTSSYFTLMIVAFVILIPLLTMRLFSEERKMRTEQLLLTAPVTITGMVMGSNYRRQFIDRAKQCGTNGPGISEKAHRTAYTAG